MRHDPVKYWSKSNPPESVTAICIRLMAIGGKLPIVLGHEGAGIVREIGEGVTKVSKGDHVVFCWQPACGKCPPCLEGPVLCDRLDKTTYRGRMPAGGMRLHARGQDVGHFNGTACFADFAVLAEEGAVTVPTICHSMCWQHLVVPS